MLFFEVTLLYILKLDFAELPQLSVAFNFGICNRGILSFSLFLVQELLFDALYFNILFCVYLCNRCIAFGFGYLAFAF